MAMVGFRVTGNVAPEKLNPVPVMLAALMVTGDVPVEERVTDCVKAVPTGSLPKFRLLLLKVRAGFAFTLTKTRVRPALVTLRPVVLLVFTSSVEMNARSS